ncbi:MAG: mannose-1-phosphate guanylyltransferase, partial [Thiotrichaceae bacterium]
MKIIPVILLGGSGTRLWPVSRKNHPKQFLKLVGDQTLLQATISRLEGIENLDSTIVVCNEDHRFTTAEQLNEMGRELGDIILEPEGKNTAPAVAVAALQALQRHDDALLLVLPSDHFIKDTLSFQAAIATAKEAAMQDHLVTFGIVPSKAEIGYGYVKRGKILSEHLYKVDQFVEKPDLATAESYLQSGDYYWNSGMFLFKASAFIQELEQFNAEMVSCCQQALKESKHDL